MTKKSFKVGQTVERSRKTWVEWLKGTENYLRELQLQKSWRQAANNREGSTYHKGGHVSEETVQPMSK
jgi:hypothetical protein